jgi:hypothetical protein
VNKTTGHKSWLLRGLIVRNHGNVIPGYLASIPPPLVLIAFVIRETKTAKLNCEAGVIQNMTNKLTQSLLVLAAGSLILVGGAAAQTQDTNGAGPGVYDPGHPRVNEVNGREQNQQDRIANGEKNGTLTPGQAAHLENREQHIENQEKADMAAHNGHLTKSEQRQLNREQNRTSRQIYKDKHDK